jgi:hypothetical protein
VKQEWINKEFQEFKNIDDKLMETETKYQQMKFALKSKDLKTNLVFEDNLFNEIKDSQVRAYRELYINMYLDLIEKLEADILRVEKFHKYLGKYAEYQNFGETIENIKARNINNNKLVAECEKNFMEIYASVNLIKDLDMEFKDEADRLDKDVREAKAK